MDVSSLLDTPKRRSLSTRSADLRITLKEWEKSFALSHSGKKPGKDDIKADQDISRKYKEYNRLRDVLSGKLGCEALNSPKKDAGRARADSGVSLTPRKRTLDTGRRRSQTRVTHPNELDPYDAPNSTSPRPFLNAIGPTPQRDGRVYGIFDLLSGSGRSSQATPSSRKRKIDALYPPNSSKSNHVPAQTPTQRPEKRGDLLQHLTADIYDSGHGGKHSRTPASEGKKFMLSQFFATPSTIRYAALVDDSGKQIVDRTPLRSQVLGLSPARGVDASQSAVDATPAYLKRSFSFKDRLLSASSGADHMKPVVGQEITSPSGARKRPRVFQRTRSMPKPLSQIVRDLRKIEEEQHDDDMDALRELEGNTVSGVQVSSSQTIDHMPDSDPLLDDGKSESDAPVSLKEKPRVWKKKGQKRTTRKSVMRPAKVKAKDAPRWVAADEDEHDDEESGDETMRVEETQIREAEQADSPYGDFSEDELQALADFDPAVFEDDTSAGPREDEVVLVPQTKKSGRRTAPKSSRQQDLARDPSRKAKQDDKAEKGKAGGTINPNAHSHMNFRSLKIRNKNSKAKGGGRFGGRSGRGRR